MAVVFLDRDGTLIEDKHYLCDPEQVILLPTVGEGLRLLQDAGFALVLITNQSGIGRGMYNSAALHAVNARMEALLAVYGVRLNALYHCPHTPETACTCRKPRTGMIDRAVQEHGYDMSRAFVIGDKACDIILGHAVQAQSILVRTGYGQETAIHMAQTDKVHYTTCCDIYSAALWIIQQSVEKP